MATLSNFQREVLERLTRIEEQTIQQGKDIAAINKTLHGNGHPGVLDRVLTLETEADLQKEHKGGIYAVIAWVVTTAIALYGALKHSN